MTDHDHQQPPQLQQPPEQPPSAIVGEVSPPAGLSPASPPLPHGDAAVTASPPTAAAAALPSISTPAMTPITPADAVASWDNDRPPAVQTLPPSSPVAAALGAGLGDADTGAVEATAEAETGKGEHAGTLPVGFPPRGTIPLGEESLPAESTETKAAAELTGGSPSTGGKRPQGWLNDEGTAGTQAGEGRHPEEDPANDPFGEAAARRLVLSGTGTCAAGREGAG